MVNMIKKWIIRPILIIGIGALYSVLFILFYKWVKITFHINFLLGLVLLFICIYLLFLIFSICFAAGGVIYFYGDDDDEA